MTLSYNVTSPAVLRKALLDTLCFARSETIFPRGELNRVLLLILATFRYRVSLHESNLRIVTEVLSILNFRQTEGETPLVESVAFLVHAEIVSTSDYESHREIFL